MGMEYNFYFILKEIRYFLGNPSFMRVYFDYFFSQLTMLFSQLIIYFF